MGSRFPSHQLSNGLYVSGRPEQPKERAPTMSSVAMPYTGGDIKRSGELGKMFDIPVDGSKSRKSGPITGAPSRTGSFGGAASHSGPIMPNAAARAAYTTSGVVSSGGTVQPAELVWGTSEVHNAILLIVVVVLFGAVASFFTWNTCFGRRAIMAYIARYPDAELRNAKNGQFVKISGLLITTFYAQVIHIHDYCVFKGCHCGNVPLESSFQRVPRCVYTSTSLYEYRGWDSKAANPTHRRFSWGLRSLEVSD
ncbi:hypothetical protein POTOM_030721 [Populus tomentosa]|uniref:Uncharacterized protein n=1 Tax=Populus tomentosa TaxID=118781 RepID=A0A8X7Z9C8_POPTO|nr:hypothetical protein POTOM_030721 [Populus tomentosa]